ncbi:MAG: penicillin acylase family protein [Gammaproteobacteria bacterium]|nr:penicillin acylase family protein [Gammaproteobacteria bacterium]
MRKVLLGVLGVLVLGVGALAVATRYVDRYQHDGTARLPVLKAPVRVVRDEQGIPYIFAATLDDALRAQGWVTAQDRGFQLEVERYLASGRLAELVGESALSSDIELRLAGIARHARRQAAILAPADRRFIELYLEGLNAYVATRADERQFGFGLLGIEPRPWTVDDVVTVLLFLSWQSSVNLKAELVAQELLDRLGPDRAAALAQVTINPDDGGTTGLAPPPRLAATAIGLRADDSWFPTGQRPLEFGSNQWVVSGSRSARGAPVVVNDPHLDARTLPGIWHPVGLITPGFRAVGAAGPGVPGLGVGRTSHIAYGVTNAYGDVVDLFIETEDPARPGNYLEGDRSYPFEVIDETIKVRKRPGGSEFREVPLRIRLTHRGPVISDHGMGVASGKLLSMRWSATEAMQADMGAFALFTAPDVDAARRAIGKSTSPFNYVIADTAGNIAHATGGRIPVRLRGDGSRPVAITDGTDPWAGFVPWDAMPGQVNPARGWVGNSNQRTVAKDFPTPYSTYFSASWRYRRLMELMASKPVFTAEDHWAFMRDTRNMMAVRIAPLMSAALTAHEDTRQAGKILAAWNHQDDAGAAAPAIFQSVYRHFARRTFEDDLGPELAGRYLGSYYLWHERLALLLDDPDSDWFDDQRTADRETRDDLFHRAAQDALAELEPVLGADLGRWQWGGIHTITFFSPLVPGKAAAGLLGGGTHPKEGSGETLNRATFKFDKPYDATSIASMRFVADLGDPDKLMAVVTGGASGRQFDPHVMDQTAAWLDGAPRYWWFSNAAIEQHKVSELTLEP